MSSLLLGVGLLAGCGQKGPLVLPPPKPVVTPPSASTNATAKPATAASSPAPVPSSGHD
ncbi:MAG: lipoprotein [Proteobacteria bacterium]|nr:lipoprotein [Pseudomonadota bacterium]